MDFQNLSKCLKVSVRIIGKVLQKHLITDIFPLSSQFDLVCVNAWMLDFTQAILNLGFLTGAFTLGYAADR